MVATWVSLLQNIDLLCIVPEETLVEATSDSDVQINHYLTVRHETKELNIIDLLIIFTERRDDYFPSYRRKMIFCFSSALLYS